MEVPTYDQLLNPTLRALHDLGGSASIYELSERVIENEGYPEEVVEAEHSGVDNRTALEYRLAWARTYLRKYGLIENSSRGIWALTARGVDTTTVDPSEVQRVVRQLDPRSKGGAAGTGQEQFPDDEDVVGDWREELLAVLKKMDPGAFERLCQRVLRESGFTEVEVTGRSGDGGIDGHGVVRLAGLLSFPVLFQSKRWDKNVTSGAVRDFRGAMMGRAENGLIITTAGFTRDARLEATRDGAPAIDLIDGGLLMDKLKELGLGVQTRTVEAVEVDVTWFDGL